MSNKNEKLPKAAITSEPVYHWIAEGVFFLFSFLFLGMYNGELLYKLQSSSLFLGNSIFAQESINQSAGLLVYASRFLIQLLFHPLLGGALLAAGLGFWWAWIDRAGLTWHDRASNTRLQRLPKPAA